MSINRIELTNSVRKQLHREIASIDVYTTYNLLSDHLGEIPDGAEHLSSVIADYDDGVCTNITTYHVGEAMEPEHYYCSDCNGSVDITDIIVEWMSYYRTYYRCCNCRKLRNCAIRKIADKIISAIDADLEADVE